MKTFDKAMLALLNARTDEANELFQQFVEQKLTEDTDDDKLSGDLEAEDDTPGLTEDGAPRPKEVYVQSFDMSRRFAKIFNHHRGNKETDAQVLNTIKENGHCFYVVKFRVTQRYDIEFYKLDNQFYAIFHDDDTPDHFERLKFYDEEDLESFMNSF